MGLFSIKEGENVMKRITILTTYFGKFNNYFDLWKNAVAYNNTIDFKLITDNGVNDVPSNMEVISLKLKRGG